MTKSGLDIKAKSTKRTDFQGERVLLLGQVTEKKEKTNPSHFLKFLLVSHKFGTFAFAPTHKADSSQNQRSHFFANTPKNKVIFESDKLCNNFL